MALTYLGAAALAWPAWGMGIYHSVHPAAWPLLALAMAAVQILPVKVHVHSQTLTMDLFGVPLMVGACVVPFRWAIVSVALAALAFHVLTGHATVRLLFNVANLEVGAIAGMLVFRAVLSGKAPMSLRGWLATAAALLTYELVTFLGVTVVMTVAGAGAPRGYVLRWIYSQEVLIPVSWALSVIAIAAYVTEPWVLLVLAATALVVALLYGSAHRLRERYLDLQSLYGFSMRLSELTELPDILEAALSETLKILRCRHVELSIPRSREADRYRLDASGQLMSETVELSELELELTRSREPKLIPAGETTPELAVSGLKDLVSVPVMMDGGAAGIMTAADRVGDGSGTFTNEDVKLLQALAAHLGTALTSSGRLGRLRNEVAAREHEAYHDSLTGLANRALFTQVVGAAIKSRKPSRQVAVMLMDLDGFKEINDTLGHHTGDAILKELAGRVSQTIGARRMAARLGGDEFAFLVPAAAGLDEIAGVAAELLRTVSAPLWVGGMVLTVRASIGVSIAPMHGTDSSSLLRRADVAMYSAKRSGQGYFIYDPETDHHSTRRLVVATELQRAVENGGLQLFYQPVADLGSGVISGVEALLRWNNDELGGAVSPVEFIPVAEQSGLIEPLTWWVLRTALQELRRWRDAGFELDMAVNISARSLFDTAIVERLRMLLAEFAVSPRHLTLEITESSMMLDQTRSERILTELSDLGLRLAIDDFGTGHSSLQRLKELPVTVVKIDKSFVKSMCDDKRDQAIVRSTIELARVMGHKVVAEGVEDQETWELLCDLGCTHAQGFHLARPMPAEICRNWIVARQHPTLAPVRRIVPRQATGT